jgi:hypothetical protein
MTDEPRQPGDMTGEPGDVTGEPGGAPGGASTGRELTPRPAEPTPAVTPREPVVPTPTTAPA